MPGASRHLAVTPVWLAVLAGHTGTVREALGPLAADLALAPVAGALPGSALARACAAVADDWDARLRALAGQLEATTHALIASAAAYADTEDTLARSFQARAR